MRKIGILGGSFNPIHNAHISLARRAYKQFHLDDMWLIPAKCPPHKRNVTFDDTHRLEMLRLAVSDYPELSIHLFEFLKDSVSYTVETLRALKEIYPDTEFYYIMGQDSLTDFPTWYCPVEIAKLASLVVACRDEEDKTFHKLLETRREMYQNPFYELKMEYNPVSSTEIRNRLQNGLSCSDLVPNKVEAYLIANQLYQIERIRT